MAKAQVVAVVREAAAQKASTVAAAQGSKGKQSTKARRIGIAGNLFPMEKYQVLST